MIQARVWSSPVRHISSSGRRCGDSPRLRTLIEIRVHQANKHPPDCADEPMGVHTLDG